MCKNVKHIQCNRARFDWLLVSDRSIFYFVRQERWLSRQEPKKKKPRKKLRSNEWTKKRYQVTHTNFFLSYYV